MVKIAIIGTGYVGLVTGACLAEIGHTVICADVSKEKIQLLQKRIMPIHEDGLEDVVSRNVKEKRLSFTTDVDSAITKSQVIFSAVGTPQGKDHRADLTCVEQVATAFAKNLNEYKVFVNKSTVPVGTGAKVKEIVSKNSQTPFDVVSNPEFLREGAAVKDFLNPDRIILGCETEKAKELMYQIYRPLERSQSPIIATDIKSAELIKYASNAMLAVRISFANEMSRFCDIVGADVKTVMKGMGLDNRIGPKFLQAGIGYGGSCFPKDVDALIMSGQDNKYNFEIISAAKQVNERQKVYLLSKLEKTKILKGKTITLWGLAFKPRTDDVREAPAKYIIEQLLQKGIERIQVFDPIATKNFKKWFPELALNNQVRFYDNKYDAIKKSDILIIVTEWDEFRVIDYDILKKEMNGRIIADGRNIYDAEEVLNNGFEYIGIGRY